MTPADADIHLAGGIVAAEFDGSTRIARCKQGKDRQDIKQESFHLSIAHKVICRLGYESPIPSLSNGRASGRPHNRG